MTAKSSVSGTPAPPYYSVIFTSLRTSEDDGGYAIAAERMMELAAQQDGFLGIESVRDADGVGITVSYWRDLESIRQWHEVAEHRAAQELGRSCWYECFKVRIARVEREYGFGLSIDS